MSLPSPLRFYRSSVAVVLLTAATQCSPLLCASPFPQPYNTEPDQSGPMPATQAAASFKLPAGFQAKVFASEPDVQNPIAMTWDAKGRLWIAENYTYAEAPRKFDMGLRDRILIFEDPQGTGAFTKRTVFTDEVQMLTSIEVGVGGIWAMCPPQLLFIPTDGNSDSPSGAPQVVLDGFTVPAESYHNFANGLRWGPDGWLYGRCGGTAPGDIGAPGTPETERIPLRGGMWRYHPKRKVFETLNTGTTNPWGHDWDKYGELFYINTVNGHLWHSITGAHFMRASTIDPNRYAYSIIDQHADHFHFDTTQSWMKSRDGAANAFGGGHAHIGALIYQGDNWPALFHDRLFTFNMHGLRANQEILERGGTGYVGRHGDDFLFSADKWFRGIDLSCGPDGAVFAIDWSDTGECHERNGVHRTSGRIFKIQHGDIKPLAFNALDKMSESELTDLHKHPNVWFSQQSRRVLVQRAASGASLSEATKRLRELSENADPVLALRGLWTLYALEKTDPAFLRGKLHHSNEHVRAWAVRLLSDEWPLDTLFSKRPVLPERPEAIDAVMPEFLEMARTDASGLVRLTLASALQRLPWKQRAALATELVARGEDAADHNQPLMVWYGLIGLAEHDPTALLQVAQHCALPLTRQYIARRLATEIESNPVHLNKLLEFSLGMPLPFQNDVLTGIAQALTGWRKAPKPPAWERLTASVNATDNQALREKVRDLSVLFGDGRALEEVAAVALDNAAELETRKTALRTLIAGKPPELRAICEKLLSVRFLNSIAAQGLSLFEDPQIGEQLTKVYSNFHVSERPQLIATLVSRPSFVLPLLAAVEKGKIPRSDLSPFMVRQIRSFNDETINARLTSVWGEFRETGADKQELIAKYKRELSAETLAKGDRSQGRLVFSGVCNTCHMLYGEGGKIGPDLTGAGRDNLDYLLENIADPSAVVSADFRMTVLHLKDGRILNGMLRNPTDHTVGLQTMSELITLEHNDIAKTEELPISLMPEGLLEGLSPAQRRDLIAYLIQKTQVPLPQ